MANKYQFDPEAYKRRLKREKERPELKERFKYYEEIVEAQPTFDSEAEALKHALPKVKKGAMLMIWQAPKELGGKWKVVSMETHKGMAPDAADQLGWSMIYDLELLHDKADDIDEIEEV